MLFFVLFLLPSFINPVFCSLTACPCPLLFLFLLISPVWCCCLSTRRAAVAFWVAFLSLFPLIPPSSVFCLCIVSFLPYPVTHFVFSFLSQNPPSCCARLAHTVSLPCSFSRLRQNSKSSISFLSYRVQSVTPLLRTVEISDQHQFISIELPRLAQTNNHPLAE